jgi:hypothetical protein
VADRIPDPAEARRYLSRKAVVETEDWDDLKWGEHAHAFTVAHSRDAAVLDDIFGLMNKAMDGGESYETFRKGLRGLMEKKGWYGRADKGPDDEGYINWRTKLIYHVNMRTAYEAGRYRQQLRGAELRPIWVYKSKLVGKNRRQDHVAMHDKALRYDDPFWNTHRPPNGWGCECSVVTLSESGAEREGVDVVSSGPSGNPPAMVEPNGSPVNWDKFTPEEWRYNPGREALAPNFSRYTNLANARMSDGRSALRHVVDRYRADMDNTRLTQGEFSTLLDRMNEKDYVPQQINYQVGNLESERYQAMRKAGVEDSKIMSTDDALYHGTGDKTESQKILKEQFEDLYQTLQSPEKIYENNTPKHPVHGREFHFVKDTGDGKVIKAVLRQKTETTALQLTTLGWVNDSYDGGQYEKIW